MWLIHVQFQRISVHIPGVSNKRADVLSRFMIKFNNNKWALGGITLENAPNGALCLDTKI